MTFIIAIDGPAGTGKSSVARAVAEDLGFIYVNTGAIYRALAHVALIYGVEPTDEDGLLGLIPHISMEVFPGDSFAHVLMDQKNIDEKLRKEEISQLSSLVSHHLKVREALLHVQRNAVQKITTGAVVEGRDIGTVVFPKAQLKVFVTAEAKDRALRRHKELSEKGEIVDFSLVLSEILKRDQRDQGRHVAPLVPAADAFILDTSLMTKEEVINWIEQLALERLEPKESK